MRNSLNENIIKKYCDSIWIEKVYLKIPYLPTH